MHLRIYAYYAVTYLQLLTYSHKKYIYKDTVGFVSSFSVSKHDNILRKANAEIMANGRKNIEPNSGNSTNLTRNVYFPKIEQAPT